MMMMRTAMMMRAARRPRGAGALGARAAAARAEDEAGGALPPRGTQTRAYKPGKPRKKRQNKAYRNRPTSGPQMDPLNMRGRVARREYEAPMGDLPGMQEVLDPNSLKEMMFDAELVRQLLDPNPNFSKIDQPGAWNALPGDTTAAEEAEFERQIIEIQNKARARRQPRLPEPGRPDAWEEDDDIVRLTTSDIVEALRDNSRTVPKKIEEADRRTAEAIGMVPQSHISLAATEITMRQVEAEARAGKIDAAVELVKMLQEAGEFTIADSAIERLVGVLADAGMVHPAADMLNNLVIKEDRAPTPGQVSALMDGLCRNRMWERAQNIWDSLIIRFEIEDTVQLTKSRMHLASLQRNGYKARRELKEFEGTLLDIGTLRLSDMGNVHDRREVITVREIYHYAMQACARDKDNVNHTFEIFNSFKHHHFPVNSKTLGILLNACQTLKDWELAEEIWADCTQNKGVVPDRKAYSCMIAVYKGIAEAEISPKPKADYWEKNKPLDYQPVQPYDQARDLIRLLKYLPSDAFFNPHYDKLLMESAEEHEGADANAKQDGLWHDAFADLHINDRPYFLEQLQKEQLIAHGQGVPVIAQQRALRNASIEGARAQNLPLHATAIDGTYDGVDEDGEADPLLIESKSPGAAELGMDLPLMLRNIDEDTLAIPVRPKTVELEPEKREELARAMALPETLLGPVDLEKTPEAAHDLFQLPVEVETKRRIVNEFSSLGYDRDRLLRALADDPGAVGPLDPAPDDNNVRPSDGYDTEFPTLGSLMSALDGKARAEEEARRLPKGAARLALPDMDLLLALLRTMGQTKKVAEFNVKNYSEEELREKLAFARERRKTLPDDVLELLLRENLNDRSQPGSFNDLKEEEEAEDVEAGDNLEGFGPADGPDLPWGGFEDDEDFVLDEETMTEAELEAAIREADEQIRRAGEQGSPRGGPAQQRQFDSGMGAEPNERGPGGALHRVWAASNENAFDDLDDDDLVEKEPELLEPFGGIPPQSSFRSDRAHMYARAEAAFAAALADGIEPDVKLLNNCLSVRASGLSIPRAEEIFYTEYKRFDVAHDKYSYLDMIKMYCRARKVDTALDMFELSLTKLGGPLNVHPDSAGYLVRALAKDQRVEESLDMLRFMKANNYKIHEYYVRILRTRCKYLKIETEGGLIPPDPHEWKKTPTIAKAIHKIKHSKKARKVANRLRHSGHRLTERLYR